MIRKIIYTFISAFILMGVLLSYCVIYAADYSITDSAIITDENSDEQLEINDSADTEIALVSGSQISNGVYLIYSTYHGTTSPKIMSVESIGTEKDKISLNSSKVRGSTIPSIDLTSTLSERAQLFKISAIGSGYYSVRPMTNSALGVAVESNGIFVTDDIGAAETISSIQSKYCWEIIENSTGEYLFKNKSTGTYLAISSSNSNNVQLTALQNSNDARTVWKMIKYTGPESTMRGVTFYQQESHMVPSGGSIDLSDLVVVYSCRFGENAIVETHVRNPHGGVSEIADISLDGRLVGNTGRVGLVTVRFYAGSGADLVSNVICVYFYPSDSSSHFYLQNVKLSNGLQYGFVEATSESTNVTKDTITFDPNQVWEIKRYGTGTNYYMIRNASTGQYLTSPAETIVDSLVYMSNMLQFVIVGTHSQPNPRQLWLIDDAPSGSGGKRLRSLYMVNQGTNFCLAVRNSDNALMQGAYVNNNSYLDEFNVLFFGNEVMYQRSHTYKPNDFKEPEFASTLDSVSRNYNDFALAHRGVSLMYQEAIDLAAESKIAIFCGHGSPTTFQISYTYESPTRTLSSKKKGILYNTDMFSSAANVDFSNIDIIIFAGCQTAGNTTTYFNLAESAHKAGAKVAIGWTATTGSDLFVWMDKFFESLNNGDTVNEAKKYADRNTTAASSRTSVVFGNGSFTFN